MSIYSIKDLERISNTKAHTIRIWEQRYGLLDPERTETNIRYYDEDQLKKLLNVCTLLQGGMKISRISKLSKQEVAHEVDKLRADTRDENAQIEAIINQSLIAAATYDTVLFVSVFDDAVRSLGWTKTYEKVIYPLLVRTGLLWIRNELLPSQEHFLSNLIRQKLFAAVDALPLNNNAPQKWLLFLNEDEDHEIGLLFAYYLVRQNGQSAIYLGTRVPLNDLSKVVATSAPTHIYTFFVGRQFEDKAEHMLMQLKTEAPHAHILFSGGSEKIRSMPQNIPVTCVPDILTLTQIIATHEA